MIIEEWVEAKLRHLAETTGNHYTAEISIKIAASDNWYGYVWMFDGTKGQRYLLTTGNHSIIDVLIEMERKVNDKSG